MSTSTNKAVKAPDGVTWFPIYGGCVIAKGLRFPNKTKTDQFLGEFVLGGTKKEFVKLVDKHGGFFV